MKKILAIALALMMSLTMLVGCGNMSIGLGNFTYEKIHIDTHHYSGCLTIIKWYENSAGIEVLTEEAGSVFASEGTYMLIDGDNGWPFCAYHE